MLRLQTMAPPHHQKASDTIALPTSHTHPAALDDCKLKSNAVRPSSPTYFFRSKLPDIDIPDHLSLAQYCLQRSHEIPDHPCLLQGDAGKSYTYGEVELYVRRVAAGLANIGMKKGDTLMLLLPNCAEFVLVFLGAAMRGATVTTCNPGYTQGEIEKQLTTSGAKLIVTKAACIGKLSSIVGSRPHVRLMVTDSAAPVRSAGTDSGGADAGAGSTLATSASLEGRHGEDGEIHVLHISELLEADEGGYAEEEIEPDDVVALPFSSGTTGLPKGVMLTHRAMVTSIAQQVEGENPNLWLREDDVVLCVLPMFHIYCMSMAMASLRVGAAMAIMGKYELGEMVRVVQREAVTVAPLVPPILMTLAKSPLLQGIELRSVRMVTCGAAPLAHDLVDSVRARLPRAIIAQGYGMTETFALSMSLSFAKQPFPTKPRSCGTVIRNAIMKIVDPNTGTSLSYNTPGEICIKGKQIMKGYLNDSISTSNTIDKDGFLHTGDIGFIDEDEELFLVDRVKEIIKYKGFQVPPAELESILINHPMIEDAACVAKESDIAGEVPIAFIVPTNESCISEDEVKEFVAKQVVSYKRLHKVIFVSHIPKSPAGKILRKDLRKKLEEIDKNFEFQSHQQQKSYARI